MEDLKEPLIDRQKYPKHQEYTPDRKQVRIQVQGINAQNLSYLDGNRMSTRNHLQKVDDSDTDSVLLQIAKNEKTNLKNSLFINPTGNILKDITDNSDENSKDQSALRQSITSKVNQSNKKRNGPQVANIDSELDLEKGNGNNGFLKKSLRKVSDNKLDSSTSDYSFNEMGDQVQTRRRFQGKGEGIKNLEKVRINPDFTQSQMIREDLEFFLPQLCCIFLKNDLSKQDEQRLLETLVFMSKISFHFAHRLLFFINSNMNYHSPSQGPKLIEKQKSLLIAIEEASINSDELLYLSNSQKILDIALNQGFKHLYPNAIKFYNPEDHTKHSPFDAITNQSIIKQGYKPPHKASFFDSIKQQKFSQPLDFKKRTQSMEKLKVNKRKPEILSQINQLILSDLGHNDEENCAKLSSLQIILNPFKHDHQEPIIEKTEFCIKAFFSTLNFVKDLTDLSEKVLLSGDKMLSLKEGLTEINKQLPATVYIPFVSGSTRNYAVLNICEDESRLFLTKERAPFMVCIEIFRPEEMEISLKEYKQKMKNEILLQDDDSEQERRHTMKTLFKPSPLKAKKKAKQKIEKFKKKLDQEVSKSMAVSQQKQYSFGLDKHAQFIEHRKLSNLSETNMNQLSHNYNLENHNTEILASSKPNFSQSRDFVQKKPSPKIFETEDDEESMQTNLNKILDQQKLMNDQYSQSQVSPLVVQEQKNSMIYALNTYLKHSNDRLMESRDDQSDLNTTKRNFKDEYSFYQNLDQVTDDEHLLKPKSFLKSNKQRKSIIEKPKVSKQTETQEVQVLNSQNNKSHNSSNKEFRSKSGQFLDDNDIEKGLKAPMINYEIGQRTAKQKGQEVIVEQNFLFSETSEQQEERLRRDSRYGEIKTWKVIRMIIKSGDDLRQEQFAMQVISLIDQLFKARKMKCKLRPYEIIATGQGCGIIEFLTDTLSIDFIKRKIIPYGGSTLLDYYLLNFGRKGDKLVQARKNFCYSMAAYSLVCYILQIKDRHNANILIDRDGHVVHIDFGFLLTHSPGKVFKAERAPFKLTQEYMQVMGGQTSQGFRRFRTHLIEGFYVIHQNADKIMLLVETIAKTQSDLPCFRYGTQTAIDELRQRLYPLTKQMTKGEVAQHIDQLIFQSYDNWGTNVYDRWQYCCQGIF